MCVQQVSMASPLEVDLSCPVCLGLFLDPLLLSCGHSFCRSCLEESWREQGEEEQRCPLCRRRSSRERPPPNVALRNISEAFRKDWQSTDDLHNITDDLHMRGEPLLHAPHTSQGVCPEHSQELRLFCQDDEQLVCLECVSRLHRTHTFSSPSKAAERRRDSIRSMMRTLADQLDVDKILCGEALAHIKAQSEETESRIKEEFEELRRFLRAEEEARIAALREEEERRRWRLTKKMGEMEEAAATLERKAGLIELEMGAGDITFLQNCKDLKQRVRSCLPDHALSSAALIDVAKHLGNVRFRAWEKMKNITPYS
ncbi:E3 ubiquitin-protein ligase TRIM35-like [Clupea harengus]|uniref:E3 ubiquitin-protein ligase TRIM35-like n=1 Tax=Clupea harengus TaxID=7950 RepID=A0A8M1KIE5_CLUHA|nr:E3 ubiquitin-protein ligase TRIM35-like [Clupea harengus]